MRRWSAIVRATALEILSEPLSLLVLLGTLALATLAPAFHYHQFGEPTRMARDAGLSALFLGGLVIAVFGIVRSLRREIETGTVQIALAHPLSRSAFFLSKTCGAAVALAVFLAIVLFTSLTVVNGAAIGGALSGASGEIARLWGPSLAIGVGTMVVPLVLAALLNRFARFRFVPTAFVLALGCAAGGLAYRPDLQLILRLVSVSVLVCLPLSVALTASAAFAVRFRANGAVALSGVLFAAALPAVGNYYLSNALSRGGSLPTGYVALAAAVTLPAVLAFLLLGLHFINGRDLS